MDRLEQKLRAYYEHNADFDPSDAFMQRMKALESRPVSVKRSRRPVAAVAALIALAAALGSGWAIFRAAKPVQTQAPETSQTAPALSEPDADDPAELSKSALLEAKRPKQQTSGASATKSAEKTVPDSAPASDPRELPTPEKPAESTPREPEENTAVEPEEESGGEDPATVPPDEPESGRPEDAQSAQPDEPEIGKPEDAQSVQPDEPEREKPGETPAEDGPRPGDDTPDANEPQIVRPEEHDIDASYLMEDGRETLALRCLSTGASVELDVTGWQEALPETPLEAPDETTPAGTSAATYTGHNTIVDIIFDKNITYHLIRGEDGTVQVELDVFEAEQ